VNLQLLTEIRTVPTYLVRDIDLLRALVDAIAKPRRASVRPREPNETAVVIGPIDVNDLGVSENREAIGSRHERLDQILGDTAIIAWIAWIATPFIGRGRSGAE